MMANHAISFKVEFNKGFEEKLDSKKAMKATKKAMNEALLELEAECKRLSPVSKEYRKAHYRPGYMRDNHYHTVEEGTDKITGFIKNRAEYWGFVQFGTRFQTAQPWITYSIENIRPIDKLGEYFRTFYKP